jgi:dihydrolipoamide dehydrogenase
MVIQAATAANHVRDAGRFHVDATLSGVDFAAVVDEMTLYKDEATFVDDRTVAVGGERVSGEKVVVAAGSRPLVPPIPGLDEVDYLTSDEALYLRERPESLVIMGGGYIAVELGYFFESMGTDVAVVEMMDTLVPREDGDVVEAFTESPAGATTSTPATARRRSNVTGPEWQSTLRPRTARRPWCGARNCSSRWVAGPTRTPWTSGPRGSKPTTTGSSKPTSTSRRPPRTSGRRATSPATRCSNIPGTTRPTRPSRAKKLDHGFVKVLAAPDGEILGCHILGYKASTMIHEVVVAMRSAGGTVSDVTGIIHAHPTLNKAVQYAFEDVPA